MVDGPGSRPRVWISRGLLLASLGLFAHGGYYMLQEAREDQYLKRTLLNRIEGRTLDDRLRETLRLSFLIPPHKDPAPPPDYHLANPALRVLGPPASLIHQNGGHCGRRSRLLIALLTKQGIPARKIHLINQDYARFDHASEYVHAVVEAKVHDRWVVLDPLYNVMYKRGDGTQATLEEIRSDPSIFQRGIAGADTTFTPYYPTLYTYNQYRKFIWSSLPGGASVYALLVRLLGPEDAREIDTPLLLETPYRALAVLSFFSATVFLIGWWVLAPRRSGRRLVPGDLPSLAETP